MKKNIPIIIISCGFIYLLFTKQNILSLSVVYSSKLFLTKIMPTILPLYIISKILINYNVPYYIAKIFHNNLYFGLNISNSLCLNSESNNLQESKSLVGKQDFIRLALFI